MTKPFQSLGQQLSALARQAKQAVNGEVDAIRTIAILKSSTAGFSYIADAGIMPLQNFILNVRSS